MKKRLIDLQIDFLRCPILLSDIQDREIFTGIAVIDTNEKIKELNFKIGDMYAGYYECDSHDMACWFNEEQFKKDAPLLLSMLKELVDELNRVNDGSYEVEDRATKYILWRKEQSNNKK